MFLLSLFFISSSADYLEPHPSLASTSSCISYSCPAPKTSKPSPTTCIWQNSSSSLYVSPCSSGSFCNTTSYLCEPSPIVTQTAYVGEPCSGSTICATGSCINSTCSGFSINKSCTSHLQCNPGLRCYSGNSTCQPQLQIGQSGCKSYMDCVNSATCNTTSSGSTGVCVGYSTVPLGSYVSDCNRGFSYMCAYGSCSSSGLFNKIGMCNYPPVSNKKLPIACMSNNDCIGSQAGNIFTSSCSCGYNANGTSYCAPFIGDIPGQSMIQVWKKALSMASGCNTARRSADGCMKMIGMWKNTTQATLLYYSYSLYQNNDDCIQLAITDSYWMLSSAMLLHGIVSLFWLVN